MKRYFNIFLSILLIACVLYLLANLFSPGSYGDAVTYEMNIEQSKLIKAIQRFKDENQQFNVPVHMRLEDHESNHRYVIYFYNPGSHEVFYTATSPSGKNSTTWALESVMVAKTDGWKDVSHGLTSSENKMRVGWFQETILKAVRDQLED